ncbi:MAG: ABC transporter substrate-binding protein [Candidatus Paceibacterota bacterium]
MNKKILVGIITAIILAGAGGYFLLTKEITKTKQVGKIRIGYIEIIDCLQLLVAKNEGFFEKQGLKIELISMPSGETIIPEVESGNLDIGFSNIVSIITMHQKGLDYKFIAPGAFRDSSNSATIHKLLVAVNSNIKKPEDLEGKIVAVNSFNNIADLALKAWVEKNNLNYNKIKVVEVPYSQMESDLKNKTIDAGILNEPYITLSLSNGTARVLDDDPFNAISSRLMLGSWFAKNS